MRYVESRWIIDESSPFLHSLAFLGLFCGFACINGARIKASTLASQLVWETIVSACFSPGLQAWRARAKHHRGWRQIAVWSPRAWFTASRYISIAFVAFPLPDSSDQWDYVDNMLITLRNDRRIALISVCFVLAQDEQSTVSKTGSPLHPLLHFTSPYYISCCRSANEGLQEHSMPKWLGEV